jgi:hypothetical protein
MTMLRPDSEKRHFQGIVTTTNTAAKNSRESKIR